MESSRICLLTLAIFLLAQGIQSRSLSKEQTTLLKLREVQNVLEMISNRYFMIVDQLEDHFNHEMTVKTKHEDETTNKMIEKLQQTIEETTEKAEKNGIIIEHCVKAANKGLNEFLQMAKATVVDAMNSEHHKYMIMKRHFNQIHQSNLDQLMALRHFTEEGIKHHDEKELDKVLTTLEGMEKHIRGAYKNDFTLTIDNFLAHTNEIMENVANYYKKVHVALADKEDKFVLCYLDEFKYTV